MQGEQTIIEVGAGLLLAAYAFIFKSLLGRIKKLEDVGCNPQLCEKRFNKLESRQDEITPILNDIKEMLASMKPLVEILMEDYKKRQK